MRRNASDTLRLSFSLDRITTALDTVVVSGTAVQPRFAAMKLVPYGSSMRPVSNRGMKIDFRTGIATPCYMNVMVDGVMIEKTDAVALCRAVDTILVPVG